MYGDSDDLMGKWFVLHPERRQDIFLSTMFVIKVTIRPRGSQYPGICSWSLTVSDSELPVGLFSNYEDHVTLEPLTPNPLEELELATLFVSITGTCDDALIPDPPKGIPNVVTAAGFRVDQGSVFVSGKISNWRHEVDRSKGSTISFQKVSLEARWNWVQKIVRIDLYFWLRLKPPPRNSAQKSKILTAPLTRLITGMDPRAISIDTELPGEGQNGIYSGGH